MRASFVDLRKRAREILRALERNEQVMILYRGRPKAIMRPVGPDSSGRLPRAKEHKAFGLWADRDDLQDVSGYLRRLRQGRFGAH